MNRDPRWFLYAIGLLVAMSIFGGVVCIIAGPDLPEWFKYGLLK